jgi:Pentapeptide repeats (8 copies)
MVEIHHRDTGEVLLRLEGDSLAGAELPRVHLRRADLRGADLRAARLVLADLTDADLRGADLCGADLRGTGWNTLIDPGYLTGADLRGARYDLWTRWPLGFQPQRHGCVRCVEVAPASQPEGCGEEAAPAEPS